MNTSDAGRLALKAMWKNRVRAGLTMLGIMIGVASVVALVSIGRGVEDFILSEFNALGADVITVSSQEPDSDLRERVEPLTLADVEALRDAATAPDVAEVAAAYTLQGTIADQGQGVQTTIRGVTDNYLDVQSWEIGEGEWFATAETGAQVAVIGADLPGELYDTPPETMIGQQVTLNQQVFRVVGVMQPRESLLQTQNISVFVPVHTAQTVLDNARVNGSLEVSQIFVQAAGRDQIEMAVSQIDAYLSEKHGIENESQKDYEVTSQLDLLNSVNQIASILPIFLAIIAGVSLLVGGVGVMNVMLASVTERTKEIGLRKAMGARRGDILLQFLVESLFLTLIGGGVGILLAWGVALAVSVTVGVLTLAVSWQAILVATGVSTLIGLTFGVLPAVRAARMDPIDALRTG